MALVTPLLLILMMGTFELGNFFMNEHILVKAVRDGARFAGRLPFSYYDACGGEPTSPAGDTRNPMAEIRSLVQTGLLSGGGNKLRNWDAATITVTTNCTTMGGTIQGIYRGRATGAPRVTVTASVPYQSVLASFGFTGVGLNLNASQHAAVMGI